MRLFFDILYLLILQKMKTFFLIKYLKNNFYNNYCKICTQVFKIIIFFDFLAFNIYNEQQQDSFILLSTKL